jgi:hypothetical protein
MGRGEQYRELKRQPEAMDYRQAMAAAMLSAMEYDGTEDAYKSLMANLGHLEEVIETSPSVKGDDIRSQEIDAALKFSPVFPRDIDDVLETAKESARFALQQSLRAENGEGTILIRKIEGVILPSGELDEPIVPKGGDFEVADFEPRLDRLMRFLQSKGIFADDVIITMGDVDANAMRKTSYAVVEIPRINRTVLICNLSEQATFVIRRNVPPAELTSIPKSKLDETYGKDVIRIVMSDRWEDRLFTAIFQDSIRTERINVREMEKDRIIQAIKDTYSVEQWLAMKQVTRDEVRADGFSLYIIAKILLPSFPEKYLTTKKFIELGIFIFGKHPALMETLDKLETDVEIWKQRILAVYPTSKDWIACDAPTRRRMKISGNKITAIAHIFGISKDVVGKNILFYQLGLKIYGNEDEALNSAIARENARHIALERSPEEWANLIKSKYPTSREWIDLVTSSSRNAILPDMHIGISALLSIFGIPNRPPRLANIKIGLAIYGNDDEYLLGLLHEHEKYLQTHKSHNVRLSREQNKNI